MSIDEVKQKFLEIIQKQNNLKGRVLDDFTEASETYVEIYGVYPDCYYVGCTPDRDKTIEKLKETFDCFFPGSYDYYTDENGKITFDKIMYDNNVLTPEGFISIERDGITVYTTNTDFRDKVFNCYVSIEIENPCEVYWVSNGQQGFGASKLTLKDGKFNIRSHYNDDFDYDKVSNFVNGKDSGLVILHGAPGTGKTYVLRNLAQENPKKKFYFMDKSTFEYISSDSLISFLFSNSVKDSIFVLEDCEILLSDRMNTGNHLLSTILNLSDGILGDGLNIKFICTFNADIDKLDKAILRKGRLKYKHEFKALTPEKTQELAQELGKNIPEGLSLTVSDIYNWEEDNGGNQLNNSKHIGF